MKKRMFLVVLLTTILLAACVVGPEDPKEFLPFCQARYDELLDDYPDLPKSYVGSCVADLASDGIAKHYAPLCTYPPFWDAVNSFDDNAGIDNVKECHAYIRSLRD